VNTDRLLQPRGQSRVTAQFSLLGRFSSLVLLGLAQVILSDTQSDPVPRSTLSEKVAPCGSKEQFRDGSRVSEEDFI